MKKRIKLSGNQTLAVSEISGLTYLTVLEKTKRGSPMAAVTTVEMTEAQVEQLISLLWGKKRLGGIKDHYKFKGAIHGRIVSTKPNVSSGPRSGVCDGDLDGNGQLIGGDPS